MLDDAHEQQADAAAWFVYLFATSDCSVFKVGFTCSPLQRIHAFSRRYFERFDLQQSQILVLGHCAAAREVEARLKHELAEFHSVAPPWLPAAAGGHTEWFGAVYFSDALTLLEACGAEHGEVRRQSAFELLRGELARRRPEFELWAWQCACELAGARASTLQVAQSSMLRVANASSTLRDWLDAYRYCAIPLFVDDADRGRTVFEAARLQWSPSLA
jgi:hypothetical protein